MSRYSELVHRDHCIVFSRSDPNDDKCGIVMGQIRVGDSKKTSVVRCDIEMDRIRVGDSKKTSVARRNIEMDQIAVGNLKKTSVVRCEVWNSAPKVSLDEIDSFVWKMAVRVNTIAYRSQPMTSHLAVRAFVLQCLRAVSPLLSEFWHESVFQLVLNFFESR